MVERSVHPREAEGYLAVHGLPARSHLLLVPHACEQDQSLRYTLYCRDARGSKGCREPHEPDHRQYPSGEVSRLWPLQTVEFGGKWSVWVMEVFRALALQSRP